MGFILLGSKRSDSESGVNMEEIKINTQNLKADEAASDGGDGKPGKTTELPDIDTPMPDTTTEIPPVPEGNADGVTKVIPDVTSSLLPESMTTDESEVTEVVTEISVEDMEEKITASTVVTATHPAPAQDYDDEDDEDDDEEDDEPHHRKRAGLITAILLIGLLVVIGGVYLVMAFHFRSHFYSNTVINGMDVSGMTVEQAKSAVTKEIRNYKLVIKERDGISEVLSGEDMKLAYIDDGEIDRLMDEQESLKWFLSLSRSKDFNVVADTAYDEAAVEACVAALECLQTENIIEPVDAKLVETADGASITPEIIGNKVDEQKLLKAVKKALDQMEPSVDLTEPDIYIYPAVRSDDAGLKTRMDDWNAYLNLNITYSFGDNVETVPKEKLAAALKDDGKKVTIASDWVRELVGEWGDKYNTFGRERKFKTHSGEIVTLPAYTLKTGELDPKTKEELTHTSDYGWLLDSEATTADLQSAIEAKTSGSRQPIFKYSAMGWDNGDLTGNYVEISLKEQHMWVYQNGVCVVDAPVVTGNPYVLTATYPGCFAIDAKKSPATLGTLATQGYSTDVTWWVPFDGGRGLHDAPWRDVFGGTEYEQNGSHGCVNTPPEIMKKVYDAVSIGEAVCVY